MECLSPYPIEQDDEVLFVDCGKCIPCLVNKRTDWSFRLEQEFKGSRGASFVTLTYSERFVPEDGVSKRHVQLFLKRLRQKIGKKLRYYAVGEYGTKTGRPHYHLLLFNVSPEEVDYVRKAWVLRGKNRKEIPIGIVHVGRVTQASIRYCTKYVVQRSVDLSSAKAQPFALMSRAYGLGACYLTDEMIAWHRGTDSPRLLQSDLARPFTLVNGIRGRLPRYYSQKIWPAKCGGRWESVRSELSKLKYKSGLEARLKNVEEIRKLGYKNPDKVITEMRDAVIARVKQKVAFSQIY